MNVVYELSNLKQKIEQMHFNGGRVEQTPTHIELTVNPSTATSGTTTVFAKITSITDANNYTATIYTKSDLSDASPTTGQAVYVMSLVDELAVNSVIPVQVSTIENIDYECIQQLSLLEKN